MSEPDTGPAVPLAYAPGGGANPLGLLTVGEAAVLAVRVLGLYYAANALLLFSTMASYSMQEGTFSLQNESLLQFTYPFSYCAIAAILFIKSTWVARRVLGVGNMPGPPLRVAGTELQAVGLSICGVVLAVGGAEELIRVAIASLRQGRPSDLFILGFHMDAVQLAGGLFQVGSGVALFCGAIGLARWWRKIRSTEPVPAAGPGPLDTAEAPPPHTPSVRL